MAEEYDSNFDTESESGCSISGKRAKNDRDDDLGKFKKPRIPNPSTSMVSRQMIMVDEYSREEKRRRVNFHSLDQYTRHKLLINYYQLTCPGDTERIFKRNTSQDKGDYQVLTENHRFVWPEEEFLNNDELTWGQRLAKKYYERLFKEYCIIDLSRFKQRQYGMRWRTETEVLTGKGQFQCGSKHCQSNEQLCSWEVLFGYREHGEKLSTMVKVRLCPECSEKLNYGRKHKKASRKQPTIKSTKIKEEIVSSAEDSIEEKTITNDDQTYQKLIDTIWRQPAPIDDDVHQQDKKQTLENDVDSYLDEFFE